jgi:nucleoside-diphosphate-sugar epimerase
LPHTFEVVDVSDGAQVLEAAREAGALLNFTVLRDDPVQAFRVNTLGAYHVMRAAVAHGIRRVVHTGPQILHFEHPAGYGPDFDVPDDAPFRAGGNLYFHTKYLGLEICRVFAQNHGLEVAALLFSQFVNPAQAEGERARLSPAAVSWDDAARAVRRAVELPHLPAPFQVLRIIGDLPHGKFSNARARRVLDWAPHDSLLHLWNTGR